MNTFLGVLTIFVASIASSTSFADASLCKQVNFSGDYQTTPDLNGTAHALRMKQDGCRLEVKEQWHFEGKKHVQTWNIDLSGVEEAKLPAAVVNANRGSEMGYKSLASFSANTTLAIAEKGKAYTDRRVQINARLTLPVTQSNHLETVVGIKGSAQLFCRSEINQSSVCTIDSIRFESESTRMLQVNSWRTFGPIQEAYINGANYVLGLFDNAYFIGLLAPQMQTITRVN